MAKSKIDWTENALLTLDEAAKLIPGADRDTLKRLARRGKLTVYRPGKAYMTTAADVREAVIKCRVQPAQEWAPRPAPIVPNSLAPTETALANIALDEALKGLRRPTKEAKRKEGGTLKGRTQR